MVLPWSNATVVFIRTIILFLLIDVKCRKLNRQNSNLNSVDLFTRQSLYSLQKILTLYNNSFENLT